MFPSLLAGLPTVEIFLILPSRHYRRGTHPLLLSAASGARCWVSYCRGLALDDRRLIFLIRGHLLNRLWRYGR
jgi:hypothetical protein